LAFAAPAELNLGLNSFSQVSQKEVVILDSWWPEPTPAGHQAAAGGHCGLPQPQNGRQALSTPAKRALAPAGACRALHDGRPGASYRACGAQPEGAV